MAFGQYVEDMRAKRALHYFITTLVCITITVLSVILVIWPQAGSLSRSTLHWNKAVSLAPRIATSHT